MLRDDYDNSTPSVDNVLAGGPLRAAAWVVLYARSQAKKNPSVSSEIRDRKSHMYEERR